MQYPWRIPRGYIVLVTLPIVIIPVSHRIIPKRIHCHLLSIPIRMTRHQPSIIITHCPHRLIFLHPIQFPLTNMFWRDSNRVNLWLQYLFHFFSCRRLHSPISTTREFYHYLACWFNSIISVFILQRVPFFITIKLLFSVNGCKKIGFKSMVTSPIKSSIVVSSSYTITWRCSCWGWTTKVS